MAASRRRRSTSFAEALPRWLEGEGAVTEEGVWAEEGSWFLIIIKKQYCMGIHMCIYVYMCLYMYMYTNVDVQLYISGKENWWEKVHFNSSITYLSIFLPSRKITTMQDMYAAYTVIFFLEITKYLHYKPYIRAPICLLPFHKFAQVGMSADMHPTPIHWPVNNWK